MPSNGADHLSSNEFLANWRLAGVDGQDDFFEKKETFLEQVWAA